MEKRTLLAVVLSVLVITIGFSIQNALFPPQESVVDRPASPVSEDSESDDSPASDGSASEQTSVEVRAVPDDAVSRDPVAYENENMRVVMDPAGAVVTSIELLDHLDDGEPVNMVLRGEDGDPAMLTRFGGPEGRPVTEQFRFRQISDNEFEFTRDFYIVGNEDEPFQFTKRFRFDPDEYLFLVDVEFQNSVNASIPLDLDGFAYTIGFGPQIGPQFRDLDGRNEFRRFLTLSQGTRRLELDSTELSEGGLQVVDQRVEWAALAGKYFALIGIPDQTRYTIFMESEPVEGLVRGHQLSFGRPTIRVSFNTDTFRVYAGPKTLDALSRYDTASENSFGLSNLNLDEVLDSRPLLGWLEDILKLGLNMFYRIIPNYGVAIILLTILVKALLYPLTRKSFSSMKRMQELNPKMNELKEKYKNDQQKQQQALAELYRKEKVNPLGGCLPMLLQIPFFIAMFGVFNNSFDLRGAVFIPGWIDDLSASESIFSWSGLALPVVGNDIRLLPLIFLASQLFTSKFMQPAGGAQSGAQQKIFKYLLPAFIFFVLYNMPAGLLVYMILTNVTTGLQQYWTQRGARKAPAAG
ncbi:MAG: membrane protein insertase YidC [Spirochaetota bacterium]